MWSVSKVENQSTPPLFSFWNDQTFHNFSSYHHVQQPSPHHLRPHKFSELSTPIKWKQREIMPATNCNGVHSRKSEWDNEIPSLRFFCLTDRWVFVYFVSSCIIFVDLSWSHFVRPKFQAEKSSVFETFLSTEAFFVAGKREKCLLEFSAFLPVQGPTWIMLPHFFPLQKKRWTLFLESVAMPQRTAFGRKDRTTSIWGQPKKAFSADAVFTPTSRCCRFTGAIRAHFRTRQAVSSWRRDRCAIFDACCELLLNHPVHEAATMFEQR